eukprot:UN10836
MKASPSPDKRCKINLNVKISGYAAIGENGNGEEPHQLLLRGDSSYSSSIWVICGDEHNILVAQASAHPSPPKKPAPNVLQGS